MQEHQPRVSEGSLLPFFSFSHETFQTFQAGKMIYYIRTDDKKTGNKQNDYYY